MKINIIVDCHNDTMLKMIDKDTFLPIFNLRDKMDNHIDLAKLKEGGLNVPFFAAYSPGYYGRVERDISRTLALINALYHNEKIIGDKFKIAYSLEDIKNILRQGKIAAISTIEGAYSLVEENAIELLKQYYDIGVRAMSLTWNYSNELGEGSYKQYNDLENTPSNGGLTNLGRQLIEKMNDLGMIIDVSHLDEGTFWDLIETTRAPILASHSGVYNLKRHDRNLKDEQLLALKENKGLVGVVLYPGFLSDKEDVYIQDYLEHIDYIVDLIGIDHVALGSDFDGAKMPKDLKDASEIGKIIQGLKDREYSQDDIEKIKYKNIFRLLEEVESLRINKEVAPIKICNDIKMGMKISKSQSIFKISIKEDEIKKIDLKESRVIIDGIVYGLELDRSNFTLYCKLKEALKEVFHIITFEIVDLDGKRVRDSKIFYI